ncbi:NAD(P)-dependent oxidoreductase [Flavobacterium sp.]|uniref:NAD(P)-dependent oxidoreductase n=1 Tax=Flavobacterium sp. TaxID=239 RepID=UPI00260E6BB2|nr:NAD(P)-dependent oxidoreductase [Flavobacterium sp.]MDD3005038.1 NAD(P)-dependent oxidoreductase [Flavobacterium sp.]
MKILANDGISKEGIQLLEQNGFEVLTTKVAQEQVAAYIQKNEINGLLVRNATKVTKELIDQCSTLQLIGRLGIDMSNVEVDHALSKGIAVMDTPNATNVAIAEMVFAHLFSGARFLHDANRNMPLDGDSNFKGLTKAYSNGIELKGKTIGIVGFDAAAKEVAKIALGLGMKVLAYDETTTVNTIKVDFFDGQSLIFTIPTQTLEEVLKKSDFITFHCTGSEYKYMISETQLKMMKENVGLINVTQEGVINEVALLSGLEEDKILFAGLDVFEEEPTPAVQVLMHPKLSLTPHIATATVEAQDRMSIEMAEKIIAEFKF